MHIGFWNCYYSLEEQCKATHVSKLGHLNYCECHKCVRLVATQQWNERLNLSSPKYWTINSLQALQPSLYCMVVCKHGLWPKSKQNENLRKPISRKSNVLCEGFFNSSI
jgi:hypothetical protein